MSEQKKVLFRSAVSGYNKSDVNGYIFAENRRFTEAETAYLGEISRLSKLLSDANQRICSLEENTEKLDETLLKLASAEREKNEISEKLNSVASSLGERTMENEELNKLNADLSEKLRIAEEKISSYEAVIQLKENENRELDENINAITKKLDETSAELESIKSENAELEKRLYAAEAENAVIAEKLISSGNGEHEADDFRDIYGKHAYVHMHGRQRDQEFGGGRESYNASVELIRQARRESEDMLRRAEESAGEILEIAQSEAAALGNDMMKTVRNVFSDVSNGLHDLMDGFIAELSSAFKSAEKNPETASREYHRFGDKLGRKIKDMKSELDRAISEKLAQFDKDHSKR